MAKYRIPSDYENQTPRATHSRRASAYGSIHPGLAIPVHHRHLNVGERIRGSIDSLLQSQPMLGPLMNGFKLVTIATLLPILLFMVGSVMVGVIRLMNILSLVKLILSLLALIW
jgi:hypothetical protein